MLMSQLGPAVVLAPADQQEGAPTGVKFGGLSGILINNHSDF